MLTIPASLRSQATTARTQALALCWKITPLIGSTVYRFTDWPHELKLKESTAATTFTYTPTGGADSTARRRSDELDSINKEMRGLISSTVIKDEDLRAGVFDGAQIDEFLVDPRVAWLGAIEHARYYVKTISYDKGTWKAEVDGLPGYLDRPTGEIWQPTCRVDLFSPLCGLNPATYEKAATVASVQTQRLVFTLTYSLTGPSDGWSASGFGDDGTLLWLTGANIDLWNEIKIHVDNASGGVFTLHAPTAYDVQVGDTLTLRPGCNKRPGILKVDGAGGHCALRYNNIVNFQGEPYIPGRDRAFKGIPLK